MRLHQGDYDEVVERAGDPVALARRFAAAGAARDPSRRPRRRAQRPRSAPSSCARSSRAAAPAPRCRPPAGSARSTTPRALLDAGADRVVVGTAAFPDPAPWAEALGERLVVALDVRDGAGAHRRLDGGRRARLVERRGRAAASRPASCASSAPRSTATARSPGPTSSSSRRSPPPACACSPPAACARRPTSPRSPSAGAEAAVVGRAILGGVSSP